MQSAFISRVWPLNTTSIQLFFKKLSLRQTLNVTVLLCLCFSIEPESQASLLSDFVSSRGGDHHVFRDLQSALHELGYYAEQASLLNSILGSDERPGLHLAPFV